MQMFNPQSFYPNPSSVEQVKRSLLEVMVVETRYRRNQFFGIGNADVIRKSLYELIQEKKIKREWMVFEGIYRYFKA